MGLAVKSWKWQFQQNAVNCTVRWYCSFPFAVFYWLLNFYRILIVKTDGLCTLVLPDIFRICHQYQGFSHFRHFSWNLPPTCWQAVWSVCKSRIFWVKWIKMTQIDYPVCRLHLDFRQFPPWWNEHFGSQHQGRQVSNRFIDLVECFEIIFQPTGKIFCWSKCLFELITIHGSSCASWYFPCQVALPRFAQGEFIFFNWDQK